MESQPEDQSNEVAKLQIEETSDEETSEPTITEVSDDVKVTETQKDDSVIATAETESPSHEQESFEVDEESDEEEDEEQVDEEPVNEEVGEVLEKEPPLEGQEDRAMADTGAPELYAEEVVVISREEYLHRKVEVAHWLQDVLKQDNITIFPGESSDFNETIVKMDMFELLKTGHLMCRALNNIMAANPSFTAQNLPTIEIRERIDMFSNLSNLSNFVRTSELYFNVDRVRLMDPVFALCDGKEEPFVECLHFVKLVISQLGMEFPFSPNQPYVSMTYDQLSNLVAMITSNPVNPQVAYDPRVVMSVQDVDVFQRLVAKIDRVETSHHTLAGMTATMNANFYKLNREQVAIKGKLDGLVEGILSAFQDVSDRLQDLKGMTELITNSATGLRSVVDTLESKSSAVEAYRFPVAPVPSANTLQIAVNPTATRGGLHRVNSGTVSVETTRAKTLESGTTSPLAENSPKNNRLSVLSSASDDMSVRRLSVLKPHGVNVIPPTVSIPVPSVSVSSEPPISPQSTLGRPSSSASQSSSSPKIFKLPDAVLNMNLPKDEIMRQSVLYETVESETDYVRDLKQMIDGHWKALKSKKFLDENQLKTIFSNVEELLPVNLQFLALLDARREENPVITGLGDIFLAMMDKLYVYDTYCANYPIASNLIKELKNREDMKAYLDAAINNPDFRGLSLESFLIKPVQRICKYPLLLRELIKKTPAEHPDYPLLQHAFTKIEEVVALVNEKTRAASDRDKLIDLQSRIDATPPLDFTGSPNVKLLKEGQIQRYVGGKPKDRMLILLNGSFMLCKQQLMNKTRYQLESTVELGGCTLNMAVNLKSLGSINFKLLKTMFEVIQPNGQESFIFNCVTEPEKMKWITLIDNAINKAVVISRPATVTPTKQFNTSMMGTLKKSNTLSMKKRPNLFGRSSKKNSSQENLAEGGDEDGQPPFEADPHETPNDCEFLVMSEKDNLAKLRGHLSFPAGVYMRVVNKSRNDYWKVENINVTGWIPVPMVKIMDNNEIGKDQVAEQLRICKTVPSRNLLVHGLSRGKSTVTMSEPAPAASTTLRRRSSASSNVVGEATAVHASISSSTVSSVPAVAEPIQVPVPGFAQWKAVDAGNGSMYYYNTDTQETSWYHPGMAEKDKTMNLDGLSPEETKAIYERRLDELEKVQEQFAKLSNTQLNLPASSASK